MIPTLSMDWLDSWPHSQMRDFAAATNVDRRVVRGRVVLGHSIGNPVPVIVSYASCSRSQAGFRRRERITTANAGGLKRSFTDQASK